MEFAGLHGFERFESDNLSDIDIVVGSNPRAVVRVAESSWRRRGLLPIVLWPYDVGGTHTVILATPNAKDCVQLDMLYDVNGRGRYGVRSDALLASRGPGTVAPTVSEVARLVYLWQKRQLKGDTEAVTWLRRQASLVDPNELLDMSIRITGSPEPARGLTESGTVEVHGSWRRFRSLRGAIDSTP